MEDIDYALVEETRPPMYTAMKYWGKKPHNIWRAYIKNYAPENGICLDPFAGSAISSFETVKTGRKSIAFDLNPLTSFIIEVFCSDFDKTKFEIEVNKIVREIKQDRIFLEYYNTKCSDCDNSVEILNSKWDNGKVYEVGYFCQKCNSRKKNPPQKQDIDISKKQNLIKINNWCPDKQFYSSPSFPPSFISAIGGNNFSNLWTKRNLYVLSSIFNKILSQKDENIKKQLLFGFIQSVHLCTKMNVPRRDSANRAYSTSWGRSAYVCAARQMEMNPLYLFNNSCLGKKQSVKSALSNVIEYIGKKPKLLYVDKSNRSKRSNNFDIKYGIIDINNITDYIDEGSIDFIITDPPYGGLVQYLDLSYIWLIWLEKFDPRYSPNLDAEITIKKDIQNLEDYKIRFQNGIKNLYKLLKPDGKIVFTFHNKDIKIWNAFLNSITFSGFKIEKVIHQQNRRTGESNVANPYGTSGTDFYIRCIKQPTVTLKTDVDEFKHYVITKSIQIIAQRNEPTPYQILFNGLLAEISKAGFDLQNFDSNIESVLSKEVGNIFLTSPNKDNSAGLYWWFKNPDKYIKNPDKKLTDRVEDTIILLLRRKVTVSLDDVLAAIFINYPNGLTPDIKSIPDILRKYANQSGGKWIYKGEIIEKEFTEHTNTLFNLMQVGKKMGYRIYIGKREQPEKINNKMLRDYSDLKDLKELNLNKEKKDRIEMIDMLWLDDNSIKYAIEVENTTNFTSGIQRASNLDNSVIKIMVIPDKREKEFKKIKDPLFIDSFRKYDWNYLYYTEIQNIKNKGKISTKELNMLFKKL